VFLADVFFFLKGIDYSKSQPAWNCPLVHGWPNDRMTAWGPDISLLRSHPSLRSSDHLVMLPEYAAMSNLGANTPKPLAITVSP
jgi:hypothetical protein